MPTLKTVYGQTYVVSSDGPIIITQPVPEEAGGGSITKVLVEDAAGTGPNNEICFTSCASTAEVTVDAGTTWVCTPGFNRGAGSAGQKLPAGAEEVLDALAVTDGNVTANGARVLTEEGERVSVATLSDTTADVTMQHAAWVEIPAAATSVAVNPSQATARALSLQLVLTPATDMTFGWLQIADGSSAVLEWVGGEPSIVAGFSYIVTLVQVSPTRILANLNMPFSVLS